MRAQLSLDLLFAFTLVTITVLGLISLSSQQIEGTETFDVSAKLKVFSIDLRDTVVKVYSSGDGFAVQKSSPISLKGDDWIKVVLNATSNNLQVEASIGGKTYTTYQRIPIQIVSNSSVTLTPDRQSLWVVCNYSDMEGTLDVRVAEKP